MTDHTAPSAVTGQLTRAQVADHYTAEAALGAEIMQLTAQRDALLDALERITAAYRTSHSPEHRMDCWEQCYAAIALSKVNAAVAPVIGQVA